MHLVVYWESPDSPAKGGGTLRTHEAEHVVIDHEEVQQFNQSLQTQRVPIEGTKRETFNQWGRQQIGGVRTSADRRHNILDAR